MKYKFWDVSRDRKKKPVTLSDRILELVAAVGIQNIFWSKAFK